MKRLESIEAFKKQADNLSSQSTITVPKITIGLGTCGIGNGADVIYEKLAQKWSKGKDTIIVDKTGCFGYCAVEPLVFIRLPNKPILMFSHQDDKKTLKLSEFLENSKSTEKLIKQAEGQIASWDFITSQQQFGEPLPGIPLWNEWPFFKGQTKLVLRDAGLINPEKLEDYIAIGGYTPLITALSMKPEAVIAEVERSGLRGRGGAGFPTARKWKLLAEQSDPLKYLICNADEGDPGAYMNRNEIESDPFALIEGMTIGAYATRATKGFVYIRAEYPLAVERLQSALQQAREAGLLGSNILGTSFSFDLEIVKGAGAFVCGEETALIASAEGKAGRAVPHPPFPAQKGYLGHPTNINNVETWCTIPAILAKGGEWYSQFGTEKSKGTKVFSLVGKVQNTGLVELTLGTPLERMIYEMGGGVGSKKRVKAIQSGGPSGGCIPADRFNATIDYESLAELGSIMGSGGMVVMDQDNCMVDLARYFVSFTAGESCGKCTPCREGLSQMERILSAISKGDATEEDLEELERLATTIKDTALCGLGQTAPNPVLTTLQYFRDEYEEHIRDKRCRAGTCEDLFLALCENSCPLHMHIPGYLALVQEGRLEEAYECTVRDNPLPGSIGRVCHFHCSTRCRREMLDDPVQQGEIHRYLADTMRKTGQDTAIWQKLVKEKAPDTGKHIAIIGAGPAGLTSAFYLARLGHQVTLYDAHQAPGGILRYGIPAYRLPKDVLDHELKLLLKLGIRFEGNRVLGKNLALKDLQNRFDAVLLCIGAPKDRPLNIKGEDLPGVYPGYDFLEAYAQHKAPKVGQRVLIVGGGNVAIDAARTLFRLGKQVHVVYRRLKEDMTANAQELEGAEEEGIKFSYMRAPVEINQKQQGSGLLLTCEIMTAGPIDTSGRPKPVGTGKFEQIEADTIIIATGEQVDAQLLQREGLTTTSWKTVVVDHLTGKTTMDKVWAAGDVVSGPSTAAEAMGMAKHLAREIDRALTGKERFASLFKEFVYKKEIPLTPEGKRKNRPRHVPPDQRLMSFVEINQGYDGDQAINEALRCLRCDVRPNARSPWR
ncbi:MAG TPA: FAD-dependent oxidoreductase [Spirochaetales bacterium]|nr:FAD-dependent oxidoreductase [Spirochaetales bacterium]HPD81174.1 FAD-dependent oxidoreductase [Spirochaetales bacterium]